MWTGGVGGGDKGFGELGEDDYYFIQILSPFIGNMEDRFCCKKDIIAGCDTKSVINR